MTVPVFRFAPSPNGYLHLGHAYSALLNQKMARDVGGRLLLRMEDIDRDRCSPELEAAMLEDLRWLGMTWEGPVRRQSEHFPVYREALERLTAMGLVYPAFMTRGEVKRTTEASEQGIEGWPRDPDGALLYPPGDRHLSDVEQARRIADGGEPYALRLDNDRALDTIQGTLSWEEDIPRHGIVEARPQDWGDVVIARKDIPTSYHLSVVIDDALQGVTHVVRGKDLFHSTSVHRLLQHLLGIDPPIYHHHELILDHDGEKLSKSRKDTSLRELRHAGTTRQQIVDMVGL
ncbi:MAG: tRNA glutamyl-Q(34) synthetase GluQRS [Phyllobacterium sp.]|uniref:tRNA glutamyl-Q(34) synthetase GluQRS n=1 Tax=Phyllobacterium sp. TaxID=1871046 RepID=UPI0030F06658